MPTQQEVIEQLNATITKLQNKLTIAEANDAIKTKRIQDIESDLAKLLDLLEQKNALIEGLRSSDEGRSGW